MADRKISSLASLSSPASGDYVPIVDISEAANADKNKRITYTTLLRALPDGSAATPSCGWLSDSGLTGFYRSAANTLSVSVNQTLVGSFQSSGLQLGAGTPAAQLHLFSTATENQVIIENSDAGTDTAPDVVLYRNSASPAASDNIGNLVFRGEDAAGNTHDYASLTAQIKTTTNTSEDGTLDLMSSAAGTLASRVRLYGNKVGIHEATPTYPLHLSNTASGSSFAIDCSTNDASSGADLIFYRHRAAAAGQDADLLSTIVFRGHNDAGTPEETNFCAIQSKIIDASDGTEDGQINLQVMDAGTLTTQFSIDANLLTIGDAVNIATNTSTGSQICTSSSQKLAFWGATAVDQPAAVSDLAHSTSSGSLPTPDGTVNISNAAAVTNAELLTYCVELEAKLELALARLRETGLIAT